MPTAVITGASQGLGRATARTLAERGWSLVVDARHAEELAAAVHGLTAVTAIPGDVTDPAHRARIATAITPAGRLDLLLNNASRLGPSPQPVLRRYPLAELGQVYQTNVLAPLALIQLLAAPLTAAGGTVVNVSSDAATDAYPGWGGYGSAKAALDQLTAVLAAEEPALHCYAFDPGDMRTALHQQAFPGEDISDRPEPEVAAAALLRLLGERPPSGRYRAGDYPAAGSPAEPGGGPVNRAASRPPEARGLSRDGVRLLAATPDGLVHARFRDLPRFLAPGDLLVVNTSATLAAALPAQRAGGRAVTVHLSNQLDNGTWLVELRQGQAAPRRLSDGIAGEVITLPGGGSVTLLRPYPDPAATRIWAASVTTGDGPVHGYLARHGQPIRYSYVPGRWPLTAYQTVFARSPGSAEMPSAARPFTADLVTRLIAAGVVLAPITLHTGVASLEAGEAPLPEWFEVPQPTADLVNLTRAAGRRVIAVGTTCTRALESAVAGSAGQADSMDDTGPGPAPGPVDTPAPGPVAAPGAGPVTGRCGWTSLVLGPEHPARVVTGLITGWHEAGASHLALLEAVAGRTLVEASYREAEAAGYLWHEFGDSCLLLPPARAARPAGPFSRSLSRPPGGRAASA